MITRRQMFSLSALGLVGLAGAAAAYGYKTNRIGFGPVGLPDVALDPVPDVTRDGKPVPGVKTAELRKGLTVLNFWASWCPYCRSEHHLLMELALDPRFTLVGVVVDDSASKVASYLKSHGNPFEQLSIDQKRVVIRGLRQRGLPSTYIIQPDGTITHKQIGALNEELMAKSFMPQVEAALKG